MWQPEMQPPFEPLYVLLLILIIVFGFFILLIRRTIKPAFLEVNDEKKEFKIYPMELEYLLNLIKINTQLKFSIGIPFNGNEQAEVKKYLFRITNFYIIKKNGTFLNSEKDIVSLRKNEQVEIVSDQNETIVLKLINEDEYLGI